MAGVSGKRERDYKTSESTQKASRDQEYYAVFNVRVGLVFVGMGTELCLVSACSAAARRRGTAAL